jgi:hypothetical protein
LSTLLFFVIVGFILKYICTYHGIWSLQHLCGILKINLFTFTINLFI